MVPVDLLSRRLLVVLGKGGVGRTTFSTALGLYLARKGKRTLLFQTNARERVSQLLGCGPVGEQISQVGENLWAVNTSPHAALHEYGLMVLRYETVYRMVLENKVAKSLLRAIPGLDDYSILGKLWWHTTEEELGGIPRWDTIVFDAPATGHAASMLRLPRSILEAVPEGPLTRDAVKVRQLLEDPGRTAGLLVTIAEEMPVNEAIELFAKMKALGITIPLLIVNQLYPERFVSGSAPMRALNTLLDSGEIEDPVLGPVLARGRTTWRRRQLNELYLAKLKTGLSLPQLRLPMVFAAKLGTPDVEELSALIERQLETAAGVKDAELQRKESY